MLSPMRHAKPYGIISLVIISVVLMVFIGTVDYEWTVYLSQHDWVPFSRFMRRSLFEGDLPGGSDPGIIYVLVILFPYLLSWRTNSRTLWQAFRPYSGFILSYGLFTGLILVQGIKLVMGRARPILVFNNGMEYSEWYEFGTFFISEGIFFGSFISGHTAAVFMLMTLAYFLIERKERKSIWKVIGSLSGIFILCYALLMGVARPMAMDHWISDSLASILLVWIGMHLFYFWILRVPDQLLFFRKFGSHPRLPLFWELRLALFIILISSGVLGAIIALRSIWRPDDFWLAILFIPAVFIIAYFWFSFKKLYRKVFTIILTESFSQK